MIADTVPNTPFVNPSLTSILLLTRTLAPTFNNNIQGKFPVLEVANKLKST